MDLHSAWVELGEEVDRDVDAFVDDAFVDDAVVYEQKHDLDVDVDFDCAKCYFLRRPFQSNQHNFQTWPKRVLEDFHYLQSHDHP